MIVFEVETKALDTEVFSQYTIADLNSCITIIALFSEEKSLRWKEMNRHTHTHTHTHALVLTLKDFKNISIKDAHKNSQKLLKNVSVGVSFLIKLHQIYNFIKTGLWHWCFPVNFEKILIPLFRTPLVAASVFLVNPLPHKGQLYQSFQICEDYLCTLFLKKCFCHTFINETGTLISRESFTLNR